VGQLVEDARGFLLTGSNTPPAQLEARNRTPLFLETSRPGSSPSATSAAGQSGGSRPPSGSSGRKSPGPFENRDLDTERTWAHALSQTAVPRGGQIRPPRLAEAR
jgi:hypothetical protein